MRTILLKTKVPGPKSLELMRQRQVEVARGPFHVTPIFIHQAEGAILEDVDGNRFIDFGAGIGVVNVGHRRPEVIEAARQQLQQFVHAGFNVTPYELYVEVCRRLNRNFAALGGGPAKSFLANSGAEAVENAVKIARSHTRRQAVICFEHAFHGRTYMAMTLTSKAKPYKEGFAPFNPEVYRAPFPYAYRWPTSSDPAVVARECFEEFSRLALSQISANQVAAVIFEPVLGEGGFIPILPAFIRTVAEFCKQHGIVLIADEIQTGFGRTGTLFACEQLAVTPDLLITAKGLGAGFPISAVTGRAEIMDAPEIGGIGGTFGGNPVSCAAALAVFDIMEQSDLLAVARDLGRSLQERMQQWKEKFAVIGDVRGLGPMQGIELVTSRASRKPNATAAKLVVSYAFEHGVICMTAGTWGNVVRLLMPLTITQEQLDEGLDIIESGLAQCGETTAE